MIKNAGVTRQFNGLIYPNSNVLSSYFSFQTPVHFLFVVVVVSVTTLNNKLHELHVSLMDLHTPTLNVLSSHFSLQTPVGFFFFFFFLTTLSDKLHELHVSLKDLYTPTSNVLSSHFSFQTLVVVFLFLFVFCHHIK